MAENILLFPTLVTKNKYEVTDEEKSLWYEAYLKHCDNRGKTHDFLGFETVHHEESLEFFFKDKLMPSVKEYLETLNVDPDFFDVHVTKSFFNVTDQNGINEHNHAENHVSFVYYPRVAKGKERDLIFYHPSEAHGNEPYTQWFESNAKNWDFINARSYSVGVEEGVIYIFPSKLTHNIKKLEGDSKYIKGFKTAKQLDQTRFCVAGDMILSRRNRGEYKRSLTPVSDWRVF